MATYTSPSAPPPAQDVYDELEKRKEEEEKEEENKNVTITITGGVPDEAYAALEAGDTDASGGTGDTEIGIVTAANMPFRFNPPLHPAARHVRVDLSSSKNLAQSLADFYDEEGNTYKANSARRRSDRATRFEGLRLGRIVQGDMALSAAMIDANERYGIRFLYNPYQLSGGAVVGTDFIPSQQSSGAFVLQNGLESITFEILLNRIPDVQSRAKRGDYLPQSITNEDRRQIQQRGTHYDVEFLYRCANGVHATSTRARTGDIGLLLPNPCNLILGPYTTRGAITNVQVDDQMFSSDMVPILSYVTVTFTRFLSVAEKEYSRLESSGITREAEESSSGTDEDGRAPSGSEVPNPSSKAMDGAAVWRLAKSAGFSPSEADIMTQIAWVESSWIPSNVNNTPRTKDLSYGLWQINMYDKLGPDRRSRYGLKSNSDLLDPATNARVARQIFLGAGRKYTDWSTYNNGSYRTVKITWR